jgi:glucokinase
MKKHKEKEMKTVVLGIDIGGTNSRLGFVDEQGRVWAGSRMETRGQEPAKALWQRLWNEAQRLWNLLAAEMPPDRVWAGIGIGAPNAHSGRGRVENPPNLDWGVVPFLEMVAASTEIPAWLANDANVAALAEGRFGAAAGLDSYILVTLGTGVGSGLVIQGRMVEGASGFAAELGHVPLVDDGRLCGCGRKGCLETYASATGLKRTFHELWARRGDESRPRDPAIAGWTAEMISRAADEGDDLAIKALAMTARYLARGVVTVIHLLSPQAVLIGGGLSLAGDLLMLPLQEEVDRLLMPVFRGSFQLARSALPDADLGILGAGALAFSKLEKPQTGGGEPFALPVRSKKSVGTPESSWGGHVT